MADAHRRLLTLGLAALAATGVAGPGITGPGADAADDEEFGEFLEFLGDPVLADEGWGTFLDGFLGAGQGARQDGGSMPPPADPAPPAGGTP